MLPKLNSILSDNEISDDPQAWASENQVEIAHIEKRGHTAVCFILPSAEARVNEIIESKKKIRADKTRENGKRVEPLGEQYRFMPNKLMIERLERIERKLDAIMDAWKVTV